MVDRLDKIWRSPSLGAAATAPQSQAGGIGRVTGQVHLPWRSRSVLRRHAGGAGVRARGDLGS